ncbi:hypothetical protein F4806DRAFT_480778 [Annulohypoxylon nitens]|nr:hypothetical protein F4806DRAFT_480778 [Annulohypoxylon nitens]
MKFHVLGVAYFTVLTHVLTRIFPPTFGAMGLSSEFSARPFLAYLSMYLVLILVRLIYLVASRGPSQPSRTTIPISTKLYLIILIAQLQVGEN